ncbi:MAG: VUT family protein [Truepera sp.]|nr:VUT family protein [Truepera sp.]
MRYLSLITYGLFILAAQAGCVLLFRLSQFGQNPHPELPLPVIVMLGVLLASPLFHLRQQRNLPAGLAWSIGLVVSLALYLLAGTPPEYLLAPLAAVAWSELLPLLFKRHAPMLIAMSVYVVCTLLATFTFDSFLPLPGYGLISVGTLFFGITFTQRDRVHGYGRKAVYLMLLFAATANVVMALTLGVPIRYVAVGFLAIMLSITADTEIYQRHLHRSWLGRVARSNAVSVPVDTIVFTTLAFAGKPFATLPWMVEVIVTDIALKLIIGFLTAFGLLAIFSKRYDPSRVLTFR